MRVVLLLWLLIITATCIQGGAKDVTLEERLAGLTWLKNGFVGYNVYIGEPYFLTSDSDPGLRNQIFDEKPFIKDNNVVIGSPDSTFEVSLHDKDKCGANFPGEPIAYTLTTATSFSSIKNDYLYLNKFAADKKIIINLDDEDKSKNAPILLESETMKKITNFLSATQGVVLLQEQTCEIAHMDYGSFGNTPKFSQEFKNMLLQLNEADEQQHELLFKNFTENYGTHYMVEVSLGAKATETRFLNKNACQYFKSAMMVNKRSDYLSYCSSRTSAFVEEIRKLMEITCEPQDIVKLNIDSGDSFVEDRYIASRGSEYWGVDSWDEKSWMNSINNPVPIYVKLEPIENLFTGDNLSKQNMTIDGENIRSWFIPMKDDICQIMGYECKAATDNCGSGDNEHCVLNELCVKQGNGYTSKDITSSTSDEYPEGEFTCEDGTCTTDKELYQSTGVRVASGLVLVVLLFTLTM